MINRSFRTSGTLRERARKHIERGAGTEGYRADFETVPKILNEALATELVCVLRYRFHHDTATGPTAEPPAAEFLAHAIEEQQHAAPSAARIEELGGKPDFSPEGLSSRSHSESVEGASLEERIREDLVAERNAIVSYGEMIRYIGNDDPTTRTTWRACSMASLDRFHGPRRTSAFPAD